MKGPNFLVTFFLLSLATSIAFAYGTSPLQDFCIATNDPNNVLFVNGKFCKDPKLATADDFFFSGLNIPGNTSNPVGSAVTMVNVNKLPGLNTLGISLSRLDYAPYGLNPLHYHPRGSEIIVVVKGQLWVGFVTTNVPGATNQLFTKLLNEGDVSVFPIGMIHFEGNPGTTNAVALSGISSPDGGIVSVELATFKSSPMISQAILSKAFQVDNEVVEYIQKQPWYNNNY